MRNVSRLILLGMFAVLCGTASARWKPEYASRPKHIQKWYKSQHNAKGQWCCDKSDGHPFFGSYSFNDDGSVTLIVDGDAHKLPPYMVLKGSNPTGHAVWWYLDVGMHHHDYCFAPGALG